MHDLISEDLNAERVLLLKIFDIFTIIYKNYKDRN